VEDAKTECFVSRKESLEDTEKLPACVRLEEVSP
jgi:hypothetical protein